MGENAPTAGATSADPQSKMDGDHYIGHARLTSAPFPDLHSLAHGDLDPGVRTLAAAGFPRYFDVETSK